MSAVWQWCGNDGSYLEYNPAISAVIEAAFQAHHSGQSERKLITVAVSTEDSLQVVVNLENYTQQAEDSSPPNKLRKVRRWHPTEFNVPLSWDHMPDDREIVMVSTTFAVHDRADHCRC